MKSAFLSNVVLAVLVGTLSLVGHGVSAQVVQFSGDLVFQPIISMNPRKCMTAASNTNGAQVTLQTCTGASNQKWLFIPNPGRITIFGDKCLDVKDGVNADGTKLQIWTCTPLSPGPNPNQVFIFNWSGTYQLNNILWPPKGKCLDVTDGNTADGTRLQIWTCNESNINQKWNAGYLTNGLPEQSVPEWQTGINNCGTGSSADAVCQTAWMNSGEDFCLWAPTHLEELSETLRDLVAWCTESGHGSRVIPAGTLRGVHFVETPDYVQVTGIGNFSKMNIPFGDDGVALGSRRANYGNPIGGLVYGNTFQEGLQYYEWSSFMSDTEYCFRACKGVDGTRYCNNLYTTMGCWWNMPANYEEGVFEHCEGDNAIPVGEYGGTTWYDGISVTTPPPHPAPSSSNCRPLSTAAANAKRWDEGEKPAFPGHTPAPKA